MRKLTLVLAVLLLLMPACSAESTLTFGEKTFPAEAEYIDMENQKIKNLDDFIVFLQGFGSLKKVDMFETPVDKNQIARLEEACPGITFGWTINIANKHYIRTDQTAFSTLHGQCSHNSREFDILKYCTQLKALDLGHNAFTDLDFLEPLTDLRVLIIADCYRLEGIDILEKLPKLEYLEIFADNLTDISVLEKLPHLMDLNISGNRIKDYSVLFGMTQLKRLWMVNFGSYIGTDGVNELQAALPDTVIMYRAEHPTANGWRVGDHYDTIYEMFHTGVYIPFEDSYPDEEIPAQ